MLEGECVTTKVRHNPARGSQNSRVGHRRWFSWAHVIHKRISRREVRTEVRHNPSRGGQSIGFVK